MKTGIIFFAFLLLFSYIIAVQLTSALKEVHYNSKSAIIVFLTTTPENTTNQSVVNPSLILFKMQHQFFSSKP